MKKLISFILLFSFLTVSILSNTPEMIAPLPSLEWQKQSLEDKLRSKIDDVVGRMLLSDQYSVDIQLDVRGSENPEWNKSEDPVDGALNPDGSPKTAEQVQAEAAKKAEDDKKKEDQGKVKFRDPEAPETPEDFIVFNKFGIEAPLIDDFNDFQPDGKIVLSMDNGDSKKKADEMEKKLNDKEKAFQEKLKEISKASPVEQIWKYNNAIDIFNNLKSVNIVLKMSQNLEDSTKQAVEKYVREINFNLGKVKPSIKFEYVLMGSDIRKPSLMEKIASALDYFSKFATFLGIVIGVLLAGFVGNRLIKKFFELNTGTDSNSSMSMENNQEEDDDKEAGAGGGGGALGDMEGGVDSIALNGVERFKSYVSHTEKDAILLVKKWLTEDDKKGKAALKALVQQMDNESLSVIFKHLNEMEKADWKKLLSSPLSKEELATANSYISNQIVQSIIVPSFIDDPETFDMLLQLKPDDVVSLIEKDFDTACLLMNALSLSFINLVLDKCDQNLQEKIVSQSMSVTPKMIADNQEKIKSALRNFVHKEEPKPFLDVVRQLIPKSNPEFEDVLFTNLINSIPRDEAEKVIAGNFPAILIPKLPEQFLKNILSTYPLKRKVHMLLSIDEEQKETFMGLFAPEGSKAFDMLQLEFETLARDEMEMDNVKAKSKENWKDFVVYSRDMIKKDKQYSNQVKVLLSEFIESKQGAAAQSPNLKVA